MSRLPGEWKDSRLSSGNSYICGYCGVYVSPNSVYTCRQDEHWGSSIIARILICSSCNRPTYKTDITQVPGAVQARTINNLPEQVSVLYGEAIACISVNAYTSAVLAFRKLLMNIAVHEGAEENLKFIQYVDYLNTNNFIPPRSKGWVDSIRQKGNIATHEINPMSLGDAEELLKLTEVLLIYIYEFPQDE